MSFSVSMLAVYVGQISLPRLEPAGLAAVFLTTLAILVLVANHRRPINRVWALTLFFLALWQAGIAIAFIYPNRGVLQLAVIFGGFGLCAVGLLIETIASPWRAFSSRLKRIRSQLFILPIFSIVFTKWWRAPLIGIRV